MWCTCRSVPMCQSVTLVTHNGISHNQYKELDCILHVKYTWNICTCLFHFLVLCSNQSACSPCTYKLLKLLKVLNLCSRNNTNTWQHLFKPKAVIHLKLLKYMIFYEHTNNKKTTKRVLGRLTRRNKWFFFSVKGSNSDYYGPMLPIINLA